METNYFWKQGFKVYDNVVFFIQGVAPDQWMSPPTLDFSNELLGALSEYRDFLQNGYDNYVLVKVFEMESEDHWAGKWNIILYSRPIQVKKEGTLNEYMIEHVVEMLLVNFESKNADVRFVIPCRMITPAHTGANKITAVGMQYLDGKIKPVDTDFNLIRQYRKNGAPPDFELGDYLDSLHAAKETFFESENYVYGHHNIIIQGINANEWTQDQRANRKISNFIADERQNFTEITPEPSHTYRLFWTENDESFMYAEETDERKGYMQKYLRIVIYCHLMTPSHLGTPGKSATLALRSIIVTALKDPFNFNTPISESNLALRLDLQNFTINQLNWKKNPEPVHDPMIVDP